MVLLCSCSKYGARVEETLKLSGKNREELEKVLAHYSQSSEDSLKLRAAKFLIENMPGHYSYGGDALYQYYENVDSIFYHSYFSETERKEKMNEINHHYVSKIQLTEDIKMISANFLITHIEQAFLVWDEKPWTKHISFDQFCEYILPYKIMNYQPLEEWRDVFYNKLDIDKEIFQYCTPVQHSAYRACSHINASLNAIAKRVTWNKSWFPIMESNRLLRMLSGSCDEYTRLTCLAMRSNGVPIAIDFTPQWPFREMGHSWNVLLASTGKGLPFVGIESGPEVTDKLDHKKSKVFRHTYKTNRELQKINTGKWVPKLFKNIFLEDVTSEYMDVQDIQVPILTNLKQKAEHVWITHFSIGGWNPVHWGTSEKGKAIFKDMGRNMLYLPGYYTKDGIVPLSYPFILTYNGDLEYFKPDTIHKQNLFLKRKYFVNEMTYYAGAQMKGGCFQASNFPDFSRYTTIDSIVSWPEFGSIEIKDTTSYRYWRYRSSPRGHSIIAEINFYDKNLSQLKGSIIGMDTLLYDSFHQVLGYAFDDNPLTFFIGVSPNNAWVGMDFGEPIQLSRIIYSPRTDDNNIRIGDLYELFYWDNQWISLGQKVATDIYLVYDNAPTNALFWLRNLTRGQEERPFAYKDGKQMWW